MTTATTTATGRTATKGEHTRQAIVRMAMVQAMEVGLEGLSLGVLAAALALSKSGLFAHFRSKQALQLAVLEEAVERFFDGVIAPALTRPRGEPRVRALFENKLRWLWTDDSSPGCFFLALSQEYDDRPGPIRDAVVKSLRDWRAVQARAVALAVKERHFRDDLDPEQFVFELTGIDAAFVQGRALLEDGQAAVRARRAFERLVESARR